MTLKKELLWSRGNTVPQEIYWAPCEDPLEGLRVKGSLK